MSAPVRHSLELALARWAPCPIPTHYQLELLQPAPTSQVWCVILAYARAAKAGAALFEAGGRQQNLAAQPGAALRASGRSDTATDPGLWRDVTKDSYLGYARA
jgi:hypothetical protein